MQCQQANELLSDYTARALDSALTVSVDNHLTECPTCREQAGALRRVWTQLDQMPLAEPPAGFHASIMSALDDQFAQSERSAAQRRKNRFQLFPAHQDWRALFRPRAMAYATALLVVVLGGLEVAHSQRAALDPLGSLIHILHPAMPAPASLPLIRAASSRWSASPSGGALTVRLQAAPSGGLALSSLNYRAELVSGSRANTGHNTPAMAANQGHFNSAGTAIITLPLAQEQQARDSELALQVTLSLPDVENAPEPQKVIIPLTLSNGQKEGPAQ